jgi:hypothetical protein
VASADKRLNGPEEPFVQFGSFAAYVFQIRFRVRTVLAKTLRERLQFILTYVDPTLLCGTGI